MSEHTPGPWEWEALEGDTRYSICAPNEGAVIEVGRVHPLSGYRPHWEQEANARLIAAAPELFDACVKLITAMVQLDKEHHGEVLFARAAIKKAKGSDD